MSQYRLMRHLVGVAALGAFATVGCFVVDDKDDDDGGAGGEAGETSGGSGGSNTGGSATGGKGGSATGGKGGSSTGGSSTGGSATGGSATGGSATGGTSGTGPIEGMAVLKFCNELYKDDVAADLTLTFAGVEVTALSGTCTPVVPTACIAIPAVEGPEVALTDPADGTVVVEGAIPTLIVADGEEILAFGTVDDATGAPTVEAGQLREEYPCADTDPFAEVLEARSTPFSLPAERSLRAQQNPAASRWTKKAVIAPGIGR